MEEFAKQLEKKGILPRPPKYTGPEIRPSRKDEIVKERTIWKTHPEGGFVPSREKGTEAELDKRQQDENRRGAAMMGDGLIKAMAGLGAGKDAFHAAGPQPGGRPKRAENAPDHPLSELARDLVAKAAGKGPVIVNVGGAGGRHEPPGAINVNNQAVPRKNIPNLVKADGADIGRLFPKGTVDSVVGRNMAPETVDVLRLATGAHDVLKPGGTIDYTFKGAGGAEALANALKAAGFENVQLIGGMRGADGRPVGGYVGVKGQKP